MNYLLKKLELETKPLLDLYIERTKEWAVRDYDRIQKLADDYKAIDAFKQMGSKRYFKTQIYLHRIGYSILANGSLSYSFEQTKKAIEHYNQSLIKLAYKIKDKNLVESKISVIYSKIGQNIDIKITDGLKTVKATTIIASGAVQRPHYRYLIN